MARGQFDLDGFYAALDAVRQERQKTWKKVADESSVSASTLTRMAQGRRPDVDSLASLADWSEIDLAAFMNAGKKSAKSGQALVEMTALFRADPSLSKEAAAAIETTLKVLYEKLRQDSKE
ncbi:MAG: helix-turn-helix domain-containing protein [Fuerstiella sp.]